MKPMKKTRRKIVSADGYIAILAVVTVSVFTLIMAKGVSYLGLNDLDSSYMSGGSLSAQAISDGCIEETLRELNYNPALADSLEPYSLGSGFCRVIIADEGGKKNIEATGTYKDYNKKISITAIFDSGKWEITDWQE
jgi:hypothetical protein